MRKQLPLLVLLLLPLLAWAQTVTVPKNVYFANVHLRLSDAAQQEIQKKVDALHRNQTYFKIKVDLANAYFPVIERVFKEEGVPDDFKYLALQESGLIGDAVSTSNAVGYWQFKREAALDFDLRMDNVVDERSHIIEASRGAAQYFKRSNKNYDNWFTSLLSYYLGYTGVKTYSKPSDKGARKMDITEKTHPYVITFLAHKVAYENFVGREKPVVLLRELRATPGQSLTDIALATKTDYAELEKYNKWLLGNSIPSDKDYYVMIPVRNTGSDTGLMASTAQKEPSAPAPSATTPAPAAKPKPTIPSNTRQQATEAAKVVKRNGLNALVARPNDTKDKLALQAGISTRKFLKYNDLHNFDEIVPGTAYYIEKKKTTADAEYHVVQPGETMQMISQHYGIRLNYLRYKNRMSRNEVAVPGRVLWLQNRRPSVVPVEVKDINAKQNIAKAPSYSRPEGTAIKETPAASVNDDTPKESALQRFFNSFKKNRTQPAAVPAREAEKSVAETSREKSVKEPVANAETTEEKVIEEAPAKQIAEEEPVKPVVREAIYPGTRTSAKPATTATATTTAKPTETPVFANQEKVTETETEAEVKTEEIPVKASETANTTEADPVKESIATSPSQEKRETVTPVEKAEPVTQADTFETPAAKSAKHVVTRGESLYSISKKYNVTVAELTAWNKLSSTGLKPDQELVIAEPLTTEINNDKDVTEEASAQENVSAVEYHTVVAGESLYSISRKYNVALDELKQWNNMDNGILSIGRKLRVAAPAEDKAAPVQEEATEKAPAQTLTADVYHTVVAGESMYQISRKYGVTIKDVMEWNKKSDFNVRPGEKLLIKKK